MKGPCTPTCCTLLCASFFCFLLAGSELELPMIGSTSFIAKGATPLLPCEAIVIVVEVSSPEVGSNVGHLFSNVVDQEQGNTIVNYYEPSSFEALSPHGYNVYQTKFKKDILHHFICELECERIKYSDCISLIHSYLYFIKHV
jgi:hypothetical protein